MSYARSYVYNWNLEIFQIFNFLNFSKLMEMETENVEMAIVFWGIVWMEEKCWKRSRGDMLIYYCHDILDRERYICSSVDFLCICGHFKSESCHVGHVFSNIQMNIFSCIYFFIHSKHPASICSIYNLCVIRFAFMMKHFLNVFGPAYISVTIQLAYSHV